MPIAAACGFFAGMDGPLVNFLVVGVQKGGTTALHEYLAEQGGVALPDVK